MKRQSHRLSLTLGICASLFTAMFGTSCEQPPILCEVASGPYAMKYFPKDPANDCLGIAGEFVGMSMYNPPKGDDREIDATRATIAIQNNSMGTLADDALGKANVKDTDPTHNQYSFGDYTARPDANDLCFASNLIAAEQDIPETSYTDSEGNPAVFPKTRLVHEWKQVQLYMTFAAPGSAATGEVTMTQEITDPATGNSEACTVTYIASGLFPPVGCEKMDDMGQGTGMPDDTLCCAVANPAAGRPFGSGIHPDFLTKCDPVLLQCVLDWSPGDTFPPLGTNPACK